MTQTLTRPAGPRRSRRLALGVAAPAVLVLSLSACGGGSSGASSSSTPTAAATGAPGQGAGNNADFQKIRECLTAAGISLPTPSNRPSGSFSPGTRPSGMPSFSGGTRPSGAPNGGGFGGGGEMQTVLQSSAAKAALKACGLTVPTGRPNAAPTQSS